MREVNQLMYQKPENYMKALCKLLSINAPDINDLSPHYIEIKARRDLAIHNGWICNEVYLRKLSDAKIESKFVLGDFTVPDEFYYGYSVHIIQRLADTIYEASKTTHFSKIQI